MLFMGDDIVRLLRDNRQLMKSNVISFLTQKEKKNSFSCQSSFLTQSASCTRSAVCSLHFVPSLHFAPGLQSAVRSLQSAFCTDRF